MVVHGQYMESSLVPTIIGLYGVTTSLSMFPMHGTETTIGYDF